MDKRIPNQQCKASTIKFKICNLHLHILLALAYLHLHICNCTCIIAICNYALKYAILKFKRPDSNFFDTCITLPFIPALYHHLCHRKRIVKGTGVFSNNVFTLYCFFFDQPLKMMRKLVVTGNNKLCSRACAFCVAELHFGAFCIAIYVQHSALVHIVMQ